MNGWGGGSDAEAVLFSGTAVDVEAFGIEFKGAVGVLLVHLSFKWRQTL